MNSNIIGTNQKNLSKFQRTITDYRALTADINKRLGKRYETNYVRNVHHGISRSDRLLVEIKRTLGEKD